MDPFHLITSDRGVMEGQPCVRGTRITVKRVLDIVASYSTREELRKDYPQLDDESIRQALAYAAAGLEDRMVPLRSAS